MVVGVGKYYGSLEASELRVLPVQLGFSAVQPGIYAVKTTGK